MTSEQFNNFLRQAEHLEGIRHLSRSHRIDAVSERLGVDRTRIYAMIKRGSDRRTALACAAVLAGLTPYGE